MAFLSSKWLPANVTYEKKIVTSPGVITLDVTKNYEIVTPSVLNGPVEIRGGRHVLWVGGHISIPAANARKVSFRARRGLVINDAAGVATGRKVHIEGLLIDGPGLAEGINTACPSADVQLVNVRIGAVTFAGADERDGTNGYVKSHPDVIQTWGGYRSLRIDGLTAKSGYQGIFLKNDKGPFPLPSSDRVWLSRVDVTAVEFTAADDGRRYAGHRMFAWYPGRVGQVRVEEGTVRFGVHRNSGWNRRRWYRTWFRNVSTGVLTAQSPPGDATFTDTLGDAAPSLTGTNGMGQWAQWDTVVKAWGGTRPGKVYTTNGTEYVPADWQRQQYPIP